MASNNSWHIKRPAVPRFAIALVFRLALILVIMFLFVSFQGDETLFFNKLILALIFTALVAELIHSVNRTNRELTQLLNAIRYSDYTVTFDKKSLGRSFSDLDESLTQLVYAIRDAKIEKEGQFQFLQKLVNQMSIGVIAVHNDEIELINPIAQTLLNAKGVKNWKLLQEMNPVFGNEIASFGDSGRKLMDLKMDGMTRLMTIELSTISILEKTHRIITIQDINSEMEQKEIEAWHKLINILTHEIMNSITPVSSLTETMQDLLKRKDGQPKKSADINDDTVNDLLFSLSTVHRRSESLQHFVSSYRKITRVPRPVKSDVSIEELFMNIKDLMQPQLGARKIELTVNTEPQLNINADQTLVEQVVINLIMNSMHALEDTPIKKIELKGYRSGNQSVIEVTDTGKGIPSKELREIFIPFFTTRENGSGIGLSLSKQIMSSHGGTIRVTSEEGNGAAFYLYFPA
jgi:nitrogen fixation/metabolism regulation signal transduction histidine kinase